MSIHVISQFVVLFFEIFNTFVHTAFGVVTDLNNLAVFYSLPNTELYFLLDAPT